MNIYTEDGKFGTTTNENGDYALKLPEKGECDLVYQFLGVETLRKKTNITSFPFRRDIRLTATTKQFQLELKTEQINTTEPISERINDVTSLFFQLNYLKLYEKKFAAIGFQQELFNGFQLTSDISYQNRSSLFNATNQSWINRNGKNYTSNNPLEPFNFGNVPFALVYEKGFVADVKNYDFNQIRAAIVQDVNLRNKRTFSYNLKAGTFFKPGDIAFLDYQHFNGNQTGIGNSNYINKFNPLP